MSISFDMKELFFDRKAVMSAADRATRKVLSKFGAFVRQTAKQSIRKRKKPAPPGQPPSSHSGLLKKLIFFGYEPQKRSVVIGPARLREPVGDAPHALEHGGMSAVIIGKRKRNVKIAARPFMVPAFEKETSKLPSMWRDSIK